MYQETWKIFKTFGPGILLLGPHPKIIIRSMDRDLCTTMLIDQGHRLWSETSLGLLPGSWGALGQITMPQHFLPYTNKLTIFEC